MRHSTVLALLIALASPVAVSAGGAPAKPGRIMSMNLCTDLLVLQLVPGNRVVSVSFLAHDAVWAIRPGLDAGVRVNHGAAEDVAAQRPDLILTGGFATPTVRRLAGRLGAPVVDVPIAEDFAAIRAVTRQVGQAVGEPEKAEALIRRMDATLRELAATRPSRAITVAAWSGDSIPGKGTLTNAIIEAAGATNIAARLPGDHYASFGLEELLIARPDALLYGGGSTEAPSLRRDQNQHPALLAFYAGRRLRYPDPLYACGLPQSAEAARALRSALEALPPAGALR